MAYKIKRKKKQEFKYKLPEIDENFRFKTKKDVEEFKELWYQAVNYESPRKRKKGFDILIKKFIKKGKLKVIQ